MSKHYKISLVDKEGAITNEYLISAVEKKNRRPYFKPLVGALMTVVLSCGSRGDGDSNTHTMFDPAEIKTVSISDGFETELSTIITQIYEGHPGIKTAEVEVERRDSGIVDTFPLDNNGSGNYSVDLDLEAGLYDINIKFITHDDEVLEYYNLHKRFLNKQNGQDLLYTLLGAYNGSGDFDFVLQGHLVGSNVHESDSTTFNNSAMHRSIFVEDEQDVDLDSIVQELQGENIDTILIRPITPEGLADMLQYLNDNSWPIGEH